MRLRMRLVHCLPVLVLFSGFQPVQAADSWALLVGVSKYQSPQINSLHYPAADATSIRDALVDKTLGGLAADHVRLLTDEEATRANIDAAVDTFLKPSVKAGDQVIIFLAGHGVAKGVGVEAKSFLLPTDVKGLTIKALEDSAVDLQALSNRLSELPAAQFTVFVDACREDPTPGRAIRGNTMTDVLGRSVQVIPQSSDHPVSSVTFYACGVGQRAFEDPNLKHGVFTYWILDGIREGAVPQKPDGAVELGRLSSYVASNVEDWAKKTSANGDFEVDQTPEIVANTQLEGPVILMRVKRPLSDATMAASPPRLLVAAYPPSADITVNGNHVGEGTLESLPQGGEYKIKAEAPGYEPVERSVKVLDGYEHQVSLHLQPGGRGLTAPADSPAARFYQSAVDAEGRQQWTVAENGYNLVLQGDPTYASAYERLASLQSRQGRNRDALATLITMTGQVQPGAHTLSLLSSAYATFAARGAGDGNQGAATAQAAGYRMPRDQKDAAALALQAAQAAAKADANSAEAQRALGLALVATDDKARNKMAATGALSKAILLDDKDPANHYSMGYAQRIFAQYIPAGPQQNGELQQAVASLQQALALRPDYYEAHRELAYCYHLMNNTDGAIKQYELANANRGAASDKDEVAGENVALSGLHKQAAQNSRGKSQQQHQAASDGYLADAQDITPKLDKALYILGSVGLGGRLSSYLPGRMGQVLNAASNPVGTVKNTIENKIDRNTGGILRGRLPF